MKSCYHEIMKPIQVYLEEEEIKRLKIEAIDKGITLTALIRLYLHIKQEIEGERVKVLKSKQTPKQSPKAVQQVAVARAKAMVEETPAPKPEPVLRDLTFKRPALSMCKHDMVRGFCKLGCK
jgi:hypothetical protein